MTDREFHQAVSRATGEDLAEIRRRGFQPVNVHDVEPDPEDRIIDWDRLQLARRVSFISQRQDGHAA